MALKNKKAIHKSGKLFPEASGELTTKHFKMAIKTKKLSTKVESFSLV